MLERIARDITCVKKSQVNISKSQANISKCQAKISKVILQTFIPHPPSSTKTERYFHQSQMKAAARVRYECEHPLDPTLTKCMLLGLYFPTSDIVCSHIIAVNNRNSLSLLGLDATCIWNEKNCLLIFHSIESKIENLEVVSI